MIKIVHNTLLGGFYVVRGSHQFPLSSRFATREQARQWIEQRQRAVSNRKIQPPLVLA